MAYKTFAESVKDDILMLLIDEPMDSRTIQARLGHSYPSIRRAIVELQDEGKLLKMDKRTRGSRYTLGTADTPRKIIPKLRWGPHSWQPTQGFDKSNSIPVWLKDTGEKITKAWITIATTANRLQDGIPEAPLMRRLNVARADLIAARRLLENNILIIDQILDNSKFWDINYLITFPNDESWEGYQETLKHLYQIYYGDKNDE